MEQHQPSQKYLIYMDGVRRRLICHRVKHRFDIQQEPASVRSEEMVRTSLAASVLFSLFLAPVALSQGHAIHTPDGSPELGPYVEEVSELSSRARANVYSTNPQSIFNGVQVN